MPYTSFWNQYLHRHPPHGSGLALTINPEAAFAAAVCLFVITCWVAYQIQSRCRDCGSIPARCRCVRGR